MTQEKCPLCGSDKLEEVSMQEYPHNNICNGFVCQKCGYKDYKEFFKPVDRRELIAWTQPRWRGVRNLAMQTGSEVSGEDGTFRNAFATVTYRDEDPAVHTYHDAIPLPLVKVATSAQKAKFLAIQAEVEKWKGLLKEAERDIAAYGNPVTWEWILQHGKPREDGYVPIPHKSKQNLANLRKGSRVVIATQSSEYYKIAGKVGKIVKKGSKDVIVRFGEHQYRIPYPDLKPADQVSAKERRQAKEGSESAAKVSRALGKVFG
jgi:hypothetical protein